MQRSNRATIVERAQGWSRQLRLTPLSPAAYIGMKVATALGRSSACQRCACSR